MYVYVSIHLHLCECMHFFGVFMCWVRVTVCEFQLSIVEKQQI